MKFNKNQTLGFTSKLSDFEIVNQEFIRCKCYMLATGDNVNGSDITLEAVQKAMARGEFYNKPVIAHLYQDPEDNNKWRVGGHDSKWVITNTSFDIVNECIPFGCIPESANLQLEEVLEADGETVNTYLTCQIILWTGRYNIMDAAYSDDIYFNQSCELSINEYHYKDNDVLSIDDFTFSALCLLNKSSDNSKNVRPCFPSCRVEKMKAFSINTDKFKHNFELMLKKLKQYESDGMSNIATATVQTNVTNKKNQMKGDFHIMNFKKIAEALSAVKFDDNNEVRRYRLLNVTDSKVFALDLQDGYKPCGFDYAITKDETENVIIDFDSKAEMSLSATDKIEDKDFEEFSIFNEINTIKEEYSKENVAKKEKEISELISSEFQKDYDELKETYDTLLQSHTILQSKVDKYEKQEKDAKIEAHKEDIRSLINSYSEKLGKCSAYLVYRSNMESHYEKTHDQVEQDLILMAGKYLTSKDTSANKRFSYNPVSTKVSNNTGTKTIESRYGHLLDKYIK